MIVYGIQYGTNDQWDDTGPDINDLYISQEAAETKAYHLNVSLLDAEKKRQDKLVAYSDKVKIEHEALVELGLREPSEWTEYIPQPLEEVFQFPWIYHVVEVKVNE